MDQAQGQIAILLEEYRAIRDDINGRLSAQATLLGFSLAGSALFFGLKHVPVIAYVIVAAAIVLTILIVGVENSRWLRSLAKRMEEIETEVNRLAKQSLGADADLLQWQTRINHRDSWLSRW